MPKTGRVDWWAVVGAERGTGAGEGGLNVVLPIGYTGTGSG